MSKLTESSVPTDLVGAAIRAAESLGRDVADVPLIAIAEEAGISRSTLLRRVGGSRRALDEAVRASGVDPGGRVPVRERAIETGGRLISENGLRSATLEAIAASSECSVHSLYATFGGRDELLRAIFERYNPVLNLGPFLAVPREDLAATIHGLYRLLADGLQGEPRVVPAMLADVFARPQGPTAETLRTHFFPRMLDGLGGWLAEEVAAGRIRDLPMPLLVQQLLSPMVVHFMLRPAFEGMPGMELPSAEETCATFTDIFLRAVATPPEEP